MNRLDRREKLMSEITRLLNQRDWDMKEWARATGIKQRLLSDIMAEKIMLDEDKAEWLLEETKKAKKKKMLRFDEPQVLVFGARKGGTGKSTLAENVAYELASRGYNVLAVDGDSQADMSSTLQCKYTEFRDKNIYDAMILHRSLEDFTIETDYLNLDLVPASGVMEELERTVATMQEKHVSSMFKDTLVQIKEENYYDFVIVDVDKTMGLVNKSFLNGANYVIVVAECALYSTKALVPITEMIEIVKKTNDKLDCLGLVFNKVNLRKNEVKNAIDDANSFFSWPAFETFISNDAAVEKSQRVLMPAGAYGETRNSRFSKQIRSLTDEILGRMKAKMKGEN